MSDSAFDHLVRDLGLALGMAGLRPAEGGQVCQLVFDARHVLQVVHVPARAQVLLSCQLDAVCLGAAQAQLMARANFMQAGAGAVLCAGSNGRVYLQCALPMAQARAASLLACIESLLDQAEAWQARLAREAPPGGQPPLRPDPAMFLQSV
ncbi:type III secretion system chaperone [Orrella sp. JC864]|uniref:type III secretion system chaperone n=1 Tax=Orrella sp. JC864 TaxID=3120298 RepID=UPI003008CE7E